MKLDLGTLWTPLPTQQSFLEAIRNVKVDAFASIAYVGALGSGKSWALCRAAIGLALSYPKIRILIGRHHSTDLRDTTQTTFFNLLQEVEDHVRAQYPAHQREHVPPLGEYHKAVNEYTFHNGSVILFRPLDEAEVKYKSLNIACFGVDEASEVDLQAVQMLMGRRRQVGYPLIAFMVSNPTSFAHWLYRWFVRERLPGHQLFRTNTAENAAHLPPGYVEELLRKYPQDWIARYLYGEWGGIDQGAPVFAGFDRSKHVRQTYFYKPNKVWVGLDFGYASPGVVWAQADRKYRLQVVREWLPRQIDIYRLIEGVIKRNGLWFPDATFAYFCGHDGNQRTPLAKGNDPRTGMEVLHAYGLFPSYRFHHREAAFTIIRNLLKIQDDGEPGLIVDPYCEVVIEALDGEYRYAKEKEDQPEKTGIYDPVIDCLRYITYQTYTLSGENPGSIQAAPAFTHRGTHASVDAPTSSYRSRRARNYRVAG